MVGEVVPLTGVGRMTQQLAPFADHPHLRGRDRPTNTLYLAADRADLLLGGQPGGGIFPAMSDSRILTDIRQSKRSIWRLPTLFHPSSGSALSFCRNDAGERLVWLDQVLTSSTFVAGERYTIADITAFAISGFLKPSRCLTAIFLKSCSFRHSIA
jgi:glutathione S-transferase